MEIAENIKRFAKDEGFPQVEHLGQWNGLDLYSAFDPEAPYIGLPQYILVGPDPREIRWASLDETEAIMQDKA